MSGSIDDYVAQSTASTVFIGKNNYSFKEDYTMHTIEVPLLASYRFVLTKTGSLHINAGPYVSYGLSAKMKLSGSADITGDAFARIGNEVNRDNPIGTFQMNQVYSSHMDLYSKNVTLNKTANSGADYGFVSGRDYHFDKSPLNRFNYGLKFGVAYELKGFQLGVNYNLMLSNMANKDFWESTRVPAFGLTGDNNMSGYKQRINSIEVKLGYVLRY